MKMGVLNMSNDLKKLKELKGLAKMVSRKDVHEVMRKIRETVEKGDLLDLIETVPERHYKKVEEILVQYIVPKPNNQAPERLSR